MGLPSSLVLTQTDIEQVSNAQRDQHQVKEAMKHNVLVLHGHEALDEALEALTTNRVSWAPVVEEAKALTQDRRVIGVVSIPQMVRLYRETLAKDSRRLRGLGEGTVMREVNVEPGMRLAGRSLSDIQLPAGCFVVSLRRDHEVLFPHTNTVIEPGDTITLLISPQGEAQWQALLKVSTEDDHSSSSLIRETVEET